MEHQSARPPIHILVVDSNPETAQTSRRWLEQAGYIALTARSASAALPIIPTEHPDLILWHVDLPDGNDLALLPQIKGNATRANLFVVLILDAQTQPEVLANRLEAGADGFIFKPVGKRELLAWVAAFARWLRISHSLRDWERQLSTLMGNLPGMAYHCANDKPWTMRFVSAGAKALTGYETADLIGNRRLPFEDLIHVDDRRAVREAVETALAENRPFVLEYRIRDAAGRERWVREQGCGVKNEAGETEVLEGFIWDITESKQAEAAVRASESQYRSTFAALIEGVMVFDPTFRVVTCNPSAERILGLALPQMQGEKARLTDWQVVGEDLKSLPHEHLPIARALATGQSQQNVVFGYVRADGALRWLLVNAEPIMSASTGLPACAVVSFIDITEQKETERKIREQLLELQRWHEATMGREHRILELKQQVNELLVNAGQPIRYPSAGLDPPQSTTAVRKGQPPPSSAASPAS